MRLCPRSLLGRVLLGLKFFFEMQCDCLGNQCAWEKFLSRNLEKSASNKIPYTGREWDFYFKFVLTIWIAEKENYKRSLMTPALSRPLEKRKITIENFNFELEVCPGLLFW